MKKLSFEFLVANICTSYYACKQYPTLYKQGLNWYQTALWQAEDICERYNFPLDRTIGVIAALSPQNKWQRNLVDAELAIKTILDGGDFDDFKVSTFHPNKQKAIDIIKGESPLNVLNSNKCRCFYINISNPNNEKIITIDGHATNVALGRLASLEKTNGLTDKQYQLLTDAYFAATGKINAESLERTVIGSQVQAVTWVYYRFQRGLS